MMDTVNEILISYKRKIKVCEASVNSTRLAAKLVNDIWDKDTIGLHESFKVLFLDNSLNVLGVYELSKGGLTRTFVDIRILFAVALKALSTGIIIAHNHPSGVLIPSESDKTLTKKIKEAGDFLDIKLVDHLIITPNNGYYSFADRGLI